MSSEGCCEAESINGKLGEERTHLPAGVTRDTGNDKSEAGRTPGAREAIHLVNVTAGTSFLGKLDDNATKCVNVDE